MSDVLNLLCDYAAAGAVVDRSLIAKVESEIARLTERLEAAEELRCELRLCRQQMADELRRANSGPAAGG